MGLFRVFKDVFTCRPKSKIIYLPLLITLAFLVLVGRGCIFRQATNYTGSHFNRGTNAVWLGVEWVNEPQSDAAIASLADDLKLREIQYVYVFTSYLKPSGAFNSTYSHAAEFTHALKIHYPAINIQAWIGLPLNQTGIFSSEGYVDLGDPSVRHKIADFCAGLMQQGDFDGVHLDAEPIPSGNQDVLTLLDEIRQAIGPQMKLSIAARRIWPWFQDIPLPILKQGAWSAAYYREIAGHVDQMAVMLYDSGLPRPELYRLWGWLQVTEISRALAGADVDLFLGIPTSEEKTRTHSPTAENMVSGLQGVIDGLNDSGNASQRVTGVAIYPYWETDAAEWAVYENLWLGRETK
ncbi:MAG: hypothetical protein HY326_03140 [Chloroflexi bacterium]|nr:hypothetical protein [Chloroflexota bacterium]